MVMVGKGPVFKDQARDTVLRPPLRVKPMGLETISELLQEEVVQVPISDTVASLPTPDSDDTVASPPTPHAENCAATTDTPQEDHPSWYWDQNCHFPGSTEPTLVGPDNVQGVNGPVGGPQPRKILRKTLLAGSGTATEAILELRSQGPRIQTTSWWPLFALHALKVPMPASATRCWARRHRCPV